jgi:hypothetical protein
MTTNDLSLRRVQSLEPQSLDEARALANAAVASRLYQVATPESALMILLTGRDLGLTASQSFRAVYVVSGKPVVSSDAMVAAIRRSGLCKSWRVIETTAERCTIETTRIEESEPERETFTLEDAKRAKLDAKDVWRAYPRDMLRHRCAAALARRVYPDVILGCYVPGEIDDPPVEPMRVEVTPSKPSRSKLSDEEKATSVATPSSRPRLFAASYAASAFSSRARAARYSPMIAETREAFSSTIRPSSRCASR